MNTSELLSWLRQAPCGTMLNAAEIARQLESCIGTAEDTGVERTSATWRERLWTAPSETRIGREELLEALGRPASWLYRHTGKKATCSLIPHRKLDGELQFVVGEVRRWLIEHEEVLIRGRTDPLVVPMSRQA